MRMARPQQPAGEPGPLRTWPAVASAMAMATAVAVVLVALLLLGWLASTTVGFAIAREGAQARSAFAKGTSPWTWTFRGPDDLVASRVFGDGELIDIAGRSLLSNPRLKSQISIVSTAGGAIEFGLPLTRMPHLRELPMFHFDASATATGTYGISVRETLTSDPVVASLGSLPGNGLVRTFRLDQLAWVDRHGQAVSMPDGIAMLRLSVTLPAREILTLNSASLAPEPGGPQPSTVPLPAHASAEDLLTWRDASRKHSSLVIFGNAPPLGPAPPWRRWVIPILYVLLFLVVSRRVRPEDPSDRLGAVLCALLVLAGPVWFIASLAFSAHPTLLDSSMFLLGVAFAVRQVVSDRSLRFRWIGDWRRAAWPLIAVVVTGLLAASVGHAPVWPPVTRALTYVAWACFQQWLMLAVACTLFDRALPRPVAVLVTALAFALLHTPNGLLMQLCFLAELGWAWWFLRHRALLPVAVAHAASALLLQACVAGGALRSLEVSARFLN